MAIYHGLYYKNDSGESRAWGRSGRGGPGLGPSAVGPGPQRLGIYKQGALCVDLRLAVLTSSGSFFFVGSTFLRLPAATWLESIIFNIILGLPIYLKRHYRKKISVRVKKST